ncbi:MAG: DUF3352 domain-containing protein [Planctomycetaceae bacterium]
MIRFRTRATIVAALLTAACLYPTGPAAAQKVSVDRRLPPDVYAYVTIPSVPELKKRLKGSTYGEIYRDKAFAEFIKDVEVQIKKGSAEIEKQIGLKLDDLLEIPSGEIAIAVGKSDRPVPAIAVFLDFGKNEETVDKILTLATKDLKKKQGFDRRIITHKGTKITSYFRKGADDEEDKDAAKKMDQAYFIKDTFFVFGTDVAFLKQVVDRWDGRPAKSFATTPAYKYIKARTKTSRPPVVTWYVDPLGLVNAAILNNPELGAGAGLAMGFLKPLGVTNFKAVGGSMDLDVGGYDSLSKTVMYVDLPATGALDLFKFPAVVQQPPKWVPADASNYMALNWSLPAAYKAVATIYGTISFGGPEALGKQIDEWSKDPAGPGIHVKKDLLDQLDGRMHVFSDFTDPDDATTVRALFALGTKDAAKIEAVLKKLAALPTFPGRSRKFKEHTIYEVDGGNFGALGTTVAIGVARKHLMLTNNAKLLEQIIAGNAKKPLADDKVYQQITAKLPKKTSMLTFQRSNMQLKAIYDKLRSGEFGENPDVDFKKLPPFAALKKYLRPSGGYAAPDKHGVYLESFSLRKKKK